MRADLRFRQKDRRPEIWDAATGAHADAPIFAARDDGISVPIQFEPWGSVFVIFRKPLPKRWITAAAPANLELRDGKILAAGQSVVVSSSDGGTQTVSLAARPADVTLRRSWAVSFTDGRGARFSVVEEDGLTWLYPEKALSLPAPPDAPTYMDLSHADQHEETVDSFNYFR